MIFIFNVEIYFICTAGVFCLKQFLFIAVYTSIVSTFLLQYLWNYFWKCCPLWATVKCCLLRLKKGLISVANTRAVIIIFNNDVLNKLMYFRTKHFCLVVYFFFAKKQTLEVYLLVTTPFLLQTKTWGIKKPIYSFSSGLSVWLKRISSYPSAC